MIDRATLYKAYSAAYGKERDHQVVVQSVDVGFVVIALVAAAFSWEWPHLTAGALLWLVVREAPWFLRPDEHRRTAVKIQERFDCSFGIPPNEVLTGELVPDHQVLALADGSSAEFKSDYFIDVRDLAPEVAVVAMQHQTATWAEVGHGRYSRLNYVVAFLATLILVIWAYLSDLGMQDAVTQIFGPAAPFIVGRLQLARRHGLQAESRADIRSRAEDALNGVTSDPVSYPPLPFARALQDRLYQGRISEGLIPAWLYRIRAEKDRRSIDVSCQKRADALKALNSGDDGSRSVWT